MDTTEEVLEVLIKCLKIRVKKGIAPDDTPYVDIQLVLEHCFPKSRVISEATIYWNDLDINEVDTEEMDATECDIY